MNTKTLYGLLVIGLLAVAGTAAAIGGDIAGYGRVEANADAHADYSGAVTAVEDLKDKVRSDAQARVDATYDGTLQTKASAESQGKATVDAGQSFGAQAKTGILENIKTNMDAFAGWAQSLWVKPRVDAKSNTLADGAGGLGSTIEHGDGYVSGHIAQELEETAVVEYNLPPPPQPKIGFLAELKMAFASFLSLS